jgi:membrane protein DedA with SNARE-associated domain
LLLPLILGCGNISSMISEWIKEVAFLIAEYNFLAAFLAGFGFFPTMTLSLALGATSNDNTLQLIIVGATGGVVGSILLYLLGSRFREKDLLKFLNGKGKFLHISEEAYNDANKYLEKRGVLFIFLSRFIPAVKIVTPILAGYLKYNFEYIPIAVFLGTALQLYFFMYLGSRLGLSWDEIRNVMDILNNVIFFLLGIGTLVYVYINRRKIFKKRKI